MNIAAIKGMNLDLTDAIKDYINKRISSIEKLCSGFEPSASLEIEVGKDTEHHNKGAHFRCSMNLSIPGIKLHANNHHEDLYASIDATQEDLRRQLKDHKEKLKDAKKQPRPDKM